MVGLGLMVAVNSLENRIASGYDAQGRAFSLVPISIILGFAALVAPAIARVFLDAVGGRRREAGAARSADRAACASFERRFRFADRRRDRLRPGGREADHISLI